mmetsp:Transcript_31614/g.76402  ORF Transcript_31614/g.76402 Transcript_31614/m.76402 type:complete len:184 (-) Transcript_31614:3901-4452(-)
MDVVGDAVVCEDHKTERKNASVTELFWLCPDPPLESPDRYMGPLVGMLAKLKKLCLERCMMTNLRPLYPYLRAEKDGTLKELSVPTNAISKLGMLDFLANLPGMKGLRRVSMEDSGFAEEDVGMEELTRGVFFERTFHDAVSRSGLSLEKFTVSRAFDDAILPETNAVLAGRRIKVSNHTSTL